MESDKIIKDKKHNKKFIIITIIIICLVINALAITFIFITNKENLSKYKKEIANIQSQNKSAFKDYENTIEYKTEWTYEELLNNLVDESKLSDNTSIKVIVNDEAFNNSSVLEFDTIGSYKIVIYLNKDYRYKITKEMIKDIEVKKEITLKVEDTIYPVIEGVSDKTITVGEKIDLLSGISAKDQAEGELQVQVEGTVDTNKIGTYTIKVFAIDANGNRTDKEFTVTVKAKTTTSNSNNKTKTTSSSKKTTTTTKKNSNGCSSSSVLNKRGYKTADKDACEKDKQASAIAKQIANSIKAKGYKTDLEKVQAAASIVSDYYYRGVHVESGYDYRTPYGVFVKGEASCAGCTRALIQVLEYLGFTNLKHANANSWTHQWVILTMDGEVGYADGQVGSVGFGCYFAGGGC